MKRVAIRGGMSVLKGLSLFGKDKQISDYLDTILCLNSHYDVQIYYTGKHHLSSNQMQCNTQCSIRSKLCQ